MSRADASPPPLLTRAVRVSYAGRRVLDGIDLTVEAGEVFGLVGLNGAGKTTFIRAMLDLTPCEGEVRLSGRPQTDPRARAGLAYLPEKYQPSPHLTGWEHLRLSLAWEAGGLDRARAADMVNALALDPVALDRRVRTYSKGMGQKLGLAAALLSSAPLLVLDEPMSGLDPRARVCLKDALKAARTQGRSVFFSSHVLADVEEICDRIGVLHGGRLIHVGAPAVFAAQHGGGTLERAFLAAIAEA